MTLKNSISQWDNWESVEESLQNKTLPLIVICFAHLWCPPAVYIASFLDHLRTTNELPFARIFLIDPEQEVETSHKLGIVASPAIVMYWTPDPHPKPFIIQRLGWKEDSKFVGATSKENIIALIRLARRLGEKKNRILSIDF